jgi:hypothetical protein
MQYSNRIRCSGSAVLLTLALVQFACVQLLFAGYFPAIFAHTKQAALPLMGGHLDAAAPGRTVISLLRERNHAAFHTPLNQ